jgi:hypothetical protein
MTILFREPEPTFVETVASDSEGEHFSDTGTEASISDYEGDVKLAPKTGYFALMTCRFIFQQASDKGEFIRVCGCVGNSCKRTGHKLLDPTQRAEVGWYDTVQSRKFVDGKLHTFVSKEDHQAKEMLMKAERDLQLKASAKYLNGSPTESEEAAYEGFLSDRKPAARSFKEALLAKPSSPTHVIPTSAKKGVLPSTKASLKAPPLPIVVVDIPPTATEAMSFMMTQLTSSLHELTQEVSVPPVPPGHMPRSNSIIMWKSWKSSAILKTLDCRLYARCTLTFVMEQA